MTVHRTEPFDDVVQSTREALREQGFGVLTEIDVQSTLCEELGEHIDRYLILGVCNPSLAARALRADPQAGLLLPCNVVVRTTGTDTVVEAADPRIVLRATAQPALADIAEQAHRLLAAAIDHLRRAPRPARGALPGE
ncbi:DUF302 domain-containing protein [Nocardia sp. CDC159]|uniref:DUF302 domain-containing protein n=2 Tax=Nocardiaceae TaxID=85025 RepID=A0A9X2IUR0_9NOCA|nr:DUF302 domain-containing protein [Nocardia pulmonis]MCM6784939.1 DUF302 domain-containing protein [Nocardia sp. CDC159]